MCSVTANMGSIVKKHEITWMLTMPTNEPMILMNDSSIDLIRISTRSIPYGLRTVSERLIDSRKQSKVIRSRPIWGHCVPIPEKTNHTGRTSADTFYLQQTRKHTFGLFRFLHSFNRRNWCKKRQQWWNWKFMTRCFCCFLYVQCHRRRYRGRQIEHRPLAGVNAGCDHLCRVAGNTVWSHMASDIP